MQDSDNLIAYEKIKKATAESIFNLIIKIKKINQEKYGIDHTLQDKCLSALQDFLLVIKNSDEFDNIFILNDQNIQYKKNILDLANLIILNFDNQLSFSPIQENNKKYEYKTYSLKELEEIDSKIPTNIPKIIDTQGKSNYIYKTIYETITTFNKTIESLSKQSTFIKILESNNDKLTKSITEKSSTLREKDEKIEELNNAVEALNNDYNSVSSHIGSIELENTQLAEKIKLLRDENEELQTKVLSSENKPTIEAYQTASKKYSDLYEGFRFKFYVSIAGITIILFVMIFCKAFISIKLDMIEFWILKISLMLIGVTLASYFLKQASHYQRLSDQHHQTAVELEAYPSFMNSVPLEEAVEIRKELALKYFGKEIDSTPHKDMSNLISDQMKSTTEMVKATTDAIKNLK